MTNPYILKIELVSSNKDKVIDTWILNDNSIINKLSKEIGKSHSSYSINDYHVI